ncbi:MAG: hypothetical protein EOM10_15100, partial [Opitutae bacterium]|nr:hypothetical protein [Opitutae bacterium]
MPWKSDYMELLEFKVLPKLDGEYQHTLPLEPLRNYYHALTQVPAWVYAVEGRRTAFLLPDNRGVSIRGSLTPGAREYALEVVNSRKTARVLAYMPGTWTGVTVRANGVVVEPVVLRVLGETCVGFDVPEGHSAITVAEDPERALESLAGAAYENPSRLTWRDAAERMNYHGLEHRVFLLEGRSGLGLSSTAGGGHVRFPIHPPVLADGFRFWLKGQESGSRVQVTLTAGPHLWRTSEWTDDFSGWKEFRLTRDAFSPVGADVTNATWSPVGAVNLTVYPATVTAEVVLADMHLLPAAGYSDRFLDELRQYCAEKGQAVVLTRLGEAEGLYWMQADEPVDYRPYQYGETNDQQLPMFDFGPARLLFAPLATLRHPEPFLAAAKQGCDLALSSDRCLSPGEQLLAGVRT